MSKWFIRVVLVITFFGLNQFRAQQLQDFNRFKNIISEGGIPRDFTSQAYNKILDDIKNNKTKISSSTKEKIFLEGIHYAINDLLHSGMVTYGDEVTMYVEEVAANLLKNEPELAKELRFYTIKSNETNAFSTFQGIIFVTTGLISQLTNEAQLAYVLSHEIAHYTEKHVVETFDWKEKNKKRINDLSSYSKEHEFEADKLGLKMYNEAGYSKEELFGTFDVLLFSYLPFDELALSKSYLNTDKLTIPEGYFPREEFPIKAIEDADDNKSSHPNIKRRKEAINKHLSAYTEWGNNVFVFGEEKFKYIRQICRFESVRTDVRDGEFDDALYSIYILEKEFPNSIYLKRLKARAWLGIAQYKKLNLLNSHLPKKGNHEGSIANIQLLLKNMDKLQVSTVAMRVIEDLRVELPEDTLLKVVWEKMVKALAYTEKFDLANYSRKSYKQALEEFNLANAATKDSNTVKPAEEVPLSKYEKIKRQKSGGELTSASLFDTSAFYLYALNDLIGADYFLSSYNEYKNQIEDEKKAEEEYDDLSSSERKKRVKLEEENQLRLNQSSIIYVEPQVLVYKKKGIDRVKSEKLTEHFSNAVVSVARNIDLNVIEISSSRLAAFGTDGFNERAILMAYLEEIAENETVDLLPTDYLLLLSIQEAYGADKVMFSLLEHSYDANINGLDPSLFFSIIFYPVLFAIIPMKILKGNEVELNVIVLDIKNGTINGRSTYYYKEPLSKFSIKARVYDLLTQVKSKPLTK